MQMIVKGVKLKLDSFFSIPYGVLELWRKTPGGRIPPPPPGPKRVKIYFITKEIRLKLQSAKTRIPIALKKKSQMV